MSYYSHCASASKPHSPLLNKVLDALQDRSPAVVVGYLMKLRRWRLCDAYKWVKEHRDATQLAQSMLFLLCLCCDHLVSPVHMPQALDADAYFSLQALTCQYSSFVHGLQHSIVPGCPCLVCVWVLHVTSCCVRCPQVRWNGCRNWKSSCWGLRPPGTAPKHQHLAVAAALSPLASPPKQTSRGPGGEPFRHLHIQMQ